MSKFVDFTSFVNRIFIFRYILKFIDKIKTAKILIIILGC